MDISSIKKYSNETALSLCSLGDPVGRRIIFSNFYFLLKKLVSSYADSAKAVNIEYDDLFLTAQIGLNQAIESYGYTSVPFQAYVEVVVKRTIWSYIKIQHSPTNLLFHSAVSLDEEVAHTLNLTLSDSVGDDDIFRSRVYSPSMIEHIDRVIEKEFDKDELILIKGRLRGFTYQEIAKANKWKRRKLDNTINSLRAKYGRETQ